MDVNIMFRQMISRAFSPKKELGPYFLTEPYPDGFQPLAAQRSLENAFAVVKKIKNDLKTTRDATVKPPSLSEADGAKWTKDYEKSKSISESIDELVSKIEAFKDHIEEGGELTTDTARDFISALVNTASRAAAELATNETECGAQSLIAINALADALHITRRSIPDAFLDQKEIIATKRNIILELRGRTQQRTMKEAMGDHRSNKTDEEQTPSPGPGSPT